MSADTVNPAPMDSADETSDPDPKHDLKSLPMAEVEKQLGSSPEGLSKAESAKRLTEHGPNEIAEHKTNPLLKFLSYFWGPIPWMIEVAVILSGAVGHWPDFFIILVLLLANAVVGYTEERQAGNAIDALKAKLAVNARALRDGEWVTPAARELVPGDVIRLRLGDVVPADARLLDGDEIEVDQSALTGESLPATCRAADPVFSGSVILRGEIGALVYATGSHTYIGKTAELVQGAHTVSHFQKAVLKIGNYLIILAVALVSVIVVVSILRGDPLLATLQFALVLTVAAIPVAMPTVLSVTMAVGARLLAKKKAIVSKLVAIEELAGVDILCADKTGTLTQNSLTLGDPFSIADVTAADLILAGALASRADNNDPIDLAVLGGLNDPNDLSGYTVTHFEPFDPVAKRTEAAVTGSDRVKFKVSKGAPQVILALAGNTAKIKPAVDAAVNDFAARGYRSLGVARADGNSDWRFLGVLPLFDPPRTDAKTTIATAKAMGVTVKMVTGDAIAIAIETAAKVGLGRDILDAAGLGEVKKRESAAVAESIENADGFAQVFPEHKYHIIDVLQQGGHIVGMTGDGVNDAAALKQADCGIAVSGATDAARAAAAIVLLTPGLSVIIDAIKESRKIFQRMNSYAMYRIAETLRVLLFMTLAILAFNFYPVTAIMIVMLALLNDGAILSIAYDNVRYKMKPEAWNMRLVLGISTVLGIVGPIAAFGLFYLGDKVFDLGHPRLQTMMYLMLSVAGHLTIFLTRTRGPFWSIRPARILLLAVLGTQAIATLIAIYGLFMHPSAGAGPHSSGATPSSGPWLATASNSSPTASSTPPAAVRTRTHGRIRASPQTAPLRRMAISRPIPPPSTPPPIYAIRYSTTTPTALTALKSRPTTTTNPAPITAADATGAPNTTSRPRSPAESDPRASTHRSFSIADILLDTLSELRMTHSVTTERVMGNADRSAISFDRRILLDPDRRRGTRPPGHRFGLPRIESRVVPSSARPDSLSSSLPSSWTAPRVASWMVRRVYAMNASLASMLWSALN